MWRVFAVKTSVRKKSYVKCDRKFIIRVFDDSCPLKSIEGRHF